LKPAAAVSTRSTRWRTAVSHAGNIIVLAVASACASHPPDAVPAGDGPYIAARPDAFVGRVIGAGYCVDFVKAAARLPRTAAWQEGTPVRDNHTIARGTAIATFEPGGSYTSQSGNHAAIYLDQDDRGIWVYDQWRGQPVHQRLIPFDGGSGAKGAARATTAGASPLSSSVAPRSHEVTCQAHRPSSAAHGPSKLTGQPSAFIGADYRSHSERRRPV
jgi:hypothetical protein